MFLIKPNLRELEELTGSILQDTETQVWAARALISANATQIVAVIFGSDGALLVSNDEVWFANVPPVVTQCCKD